MAFLQTSPSFTVRPVRHRSALVEGIRTYLRERREHRLLAALARKPPHLLADMGFDPEAVHAAVDHGWDEVVRQRLLPAIVGGGRQPETRSVVGG